MGFIDNVTVNRRTSTKCLFTMTKYSEHNIAPLVAGTHMQNALLQNPSKKVFEEKYLSISEAKRDD